jgi:hypothetical protein
MAKKTSGHQGSSGEADVPSVSRKVIAKPSAPYERKAEEGGAEKASEGQPASPASGDKSGAAASAAAPDAGKPEPVKTGKGGRKEGKEAPRAPETTTAEAAPAASAPAAPAAAVAAEPAPAAAAPEQASPAPVTPPRPAPAPAGDFAAPPELDAAAEFAELLPPRFIQKWDPSTPAPPPAKAPPGDSRSFRRRTEAGEEFVLIYRSQTFLIRRSGRVGVLGTWTITDYPHVGAAAHAYAQQCSELTAAGFRDLR